MATLTGEAINSTYPLLLKVVDTGIDGTLRGIEDGDATATTLMLSTTGIKSSGTLEVTGTSIFTGKIASDLVVGASSDGQDVTFYGDGAGKFMLWDTDSDDGRLRLMDNVQIGFGASNDMHIEHNGTDNFIAVANGALNIATTVGGIAVNIGNATSQTTIGDNLVVTGDLTVTGNNILYGAASAASLKVLASSGTNTAGADLTIASGQGTGSGAGGSIIFQTAIAGGSGSSANALATGMTIKQGGDVEIVSDNQVELKFTTSGQAANVISEGNMVIKSQSSKTLGLGANDQDDSLVIDASENVTLTGGYLVEARTIIKIKATDFHSNDDVSGIQMSSVIDSTSNFGIIGSSITEFWAYIDVPLGYTATKVRVNGSDDTNDVEVFTLDLDDGTISSEISDSGLQVNDDTVLGSNHVGADDKILLIKVDVAATDDVIYGGYVTIAAT